MSVTQVNIPGIVAEEEAAERPAARRKIDRSERTRRIVRSAVSLVVGVLLWEAIARLVVHNDAFLAAPSAVAKRGWEMILNGELLSNTWVSMQELIYGFIIGAIAGIAIGAAMATWKSVSDYLEPWIAGLYAAPMIAFAPVVIIWFGVGIASKVAVVIMMVVFPMIINTQAGLESTDRRLLTVARAFCASGPRIFRTVSIPSAAPFIVAGMRLAVGRGLVGVVVGELFGSRAGLGNIITTASSVFDMPTLFVAVVTLAITGVVLTYLLRAVEMRLAAWREVA
ncbi:MAG TPA: ABC transporter permease [Candidatus Binatia bacterium]|nr:ABC transporter permease [Candidatus Binatia bacterium]